MSIKKMITIDGNEAAARVAYKTNEVIAIYPITPSSPMGELSDAWSVMGDKNVWGTVPAVIEMQSEGGASGAVHGALQTGSLTTTFTASQGLLLMIPNMYKIAGELTPTVFHVTARTVASHALSIFGDHSDVMATRQTGFALLASNSVQEAMDFALIAQAATFRSRVPFLHFFDGFRTSHEVTKIDPLQDQDIRALIDEELVAAHRRRALNPNRPVIRGTAHNPDTFFQARETVNPFYAATPKIVQKEMNALARRVGRRYRIFEYCGSPQAERVIVVMGSGAETVHETITHLNARREKVGLIKVRLFRPFSSGHFIRALPETVRQIAVLDRTKEPGSVGEPLYQDVVTALWEAFPGRQLPTVIGGRYGLSSKEFTPGMIKAIFDELAKKKPKNHFTIGIRDDVSGTSLDYDPDFAPQEKRVFRGLFYGLGADGTVSANKNSIKIIGEETDNYAQGYFVYDSKKSGSMTISHLRFGKQLIQSSYLIRSANFLAVHNFEFLKTQDILRQAAPGGVLLLNSAYKASEVWEALPRLVQQRILEKGLKVYTIDALRVARKSGLGVRINTIMQTCFFAISDILPTNLALRKIKQSIRKSYGSKGETIVKRNFDAVDQARVALEEVVLPEKVTAVAEVTDRLEGAPDFVRQVTVPLLAGGGDELPVSALPVDGSWPTDTARWEKRNIADEIPVWDPTICIQCNKCTLVCPHTVIRPKIFPRSLLAAAPPGFKSVPAKGREWTAEEVYNLQVAPEDCTGCAICVDICPVKDKTDTSRRAINMQPQLPLLEEERENWTFFLSLPEVQRERVKRETPRDSQLLQPLFEFSGACSGCGETPYLKLATQLFGDRMLIANATGCSSIYGGNLPTSPWTVNAEGRGPTWNNSLFEDNAEFGLGFRLSIDKHTDRARELLVQLRDQIGPELMEAILEADQGDEAGIFTQRERIAELHRILGKSTKRAARQLLSIADNLVKKSVWIVGGDGWAYDIGFGGLDHVLASGRDVNILVLDTEVYSNTGGQASKATPLGAVAKFAASGKDSAKKDLGMIAMSYGNVYVASVALGANDSQTVKAFLEAEAYPGPSLIIAYSHCIAHGINMTAGMRQQKAAVESGHWILYRHNPALNPPFILDSKPPKIPIRDYLYNENRYKMLTKIRPRRAKVLLERADRAVKERYQHFRRRSQPEAEPKLNREEAA